MVGQSSRIKRGREFLSASSRTSPSGLGLVCPAVKGCEEEGNEAVGIKASSGGFRDGHWGLKMSWNENRPAWLLEASLWDRKDAWFTRLELTAKA